LIRSGERRGEEVRNAEGQRESCQPYPAFLDGRGKKEETPMAYDGFGGVSKKWLNKSPRGKERDGGKRVGLKGV